MKTIENLNISSYTELEWSINIPNKRESLRIANEILNWNFDLNDYVALVMYESITNRSSIENEQNILDAINLFADKFNLIPALTYELLIMLNPIHDKPFLFSREYSWDELLFYKTHQNIEKLLYKVAQNIFHLYSNPSIDKIAWILDEIENSLLSVSEIMNEFMKQFSKVWFENIRKYYLESHRKDYLWKNYNWPSWAFTATFPFIDLTFWIKEIWNNYSLNDDLLPIMSWRWYTTISDVKHIEKLIVEKWTIDKLFEKWTLEYDKILSILNFVLQFRSQHKWTANKYIWKVNLEKSWTWWSYNAWDYLDKHIENTKCVIKNIIS